MTLSIHTIERYRLIHTDVEVRAVMYTGLNDEEVKKLAPYSSGGHGEICWNLPYDDLLTPFHTGSSPSRFQRLLVNNFIVSFNKCKMKKNLHDCFDFSPMTINTPFCFVISDSDFNYNFRRL